MKAGTWLRSRINDRFAVVEGASDELVLLRPEESLEVHLLPPETVKKDWYLFRRIRSIEKTPMPEWVTVGAYITDTDGDWFHVTEIRHGYWAMLDLVWLPSDRRTFHIASAFHIVRSYAPIPSRYERVANGP